MPRRALKPSPESRAGREPGLPARPRRSKRLGLAAAVAAIAVAAVAWAMAPESPTRLRDRAEAAERAGDWPNALRAWRAVNRTRLADARTDRAEARACLALGRAADAERALRRAIEADPTDAEPWRAMLQLLRVEDRPLEALRLGWEAYADVAPESRRELLRDLTLAILADLPDDLARETLGRWVAADPGDADAQVALLQRIAAQPMSGDPDRPARIAALEGLLARSPGHTPAREALAVALADGGQPDRGRQVLNSWPSDARDARYWRLLGRWELDYEHRPADAVASFERALADLPHDWKTQYRLARALKTLGRAGEANRAAETVKRLREVLDPTTLGPRLNADLAHLDDPRSLLDLADLCDCAGLSRLADAWRKESAAARISGDGHPLEGMDKF